MHRMRSITCLAVAGWMALAGTVWAEESTSSLETQQLRAAIAKAIPLLEAASRGSAEQRQCFTCHHQALPVLALTAAQRRGLAVDEENLLRQVAHTAAHLERGQDGYAQGRGQGGQAITAGYALWTLEAGEHPAGTVTEAVAHYLLEHQQEQRHWSHPGQRPPSSGSNFTTTYVALRGLAAYATAAQQAKLEARRAAVAAWLAETEPADTEDSVFRLWSLAAVGADAALIQRAASQLAAQQLPDGGWAQTESMESDAYATGSVLVSLVEAGGKTSGEALQRGRSYLLQTQLPDGSWHVSTRAEPFQSYYESGFPHGADQFISTAATSWAAWALTLALPDR